jgi:uncharacterized protein YqjF (DUF2071 family)
MSKAYDIYGSGDAGTQELRDIFTRFDIPYTFVDIRRSHPGRGIDPLVFLRSNRLDSVPQVFEATGEYVGDFSETIRQFVVRNEIAA